MSWKVLETEKIFELGYLKIRGEKCEMPDGRIMPRYFVVDFSDWVQVLPITPEGEMVLVSQYRHAAGVTCLELPGGAMSLNNDEEPLEAGRRELLEETGFDSKEDYVSLGFHYPNPALQSNKVHGFLALNCEYVQKPELDPYEDLEVVKMPVKELYEKLERGEITHSLMVPTLVLAKKYLTEYF